MGAAAAEASDEKAWPISLDRQGTPDGWSLGTSVPRFPVPAPDPHSGGPMRTILAGLWLIATVLAAPRLGDAVTVLPFFDNFNRSDSTTVGNGWSQYAVGGSAVIQNNTLRLTSPPGGTNTCPCASGNCNCDGVKVFRNLPQQAALRVTGRFALNGTGATLGPGFSRVWVHVRADGATSLRNGYGFDFRLDPFDNQLRIEDTTDDGHNGPFLAEIDNLPLSLGRDLSFEMLVFADNSIQVRLWDTMNGTRPTAATLSYGPYTPMSSGSNLALVESTPDMATGDVTFYNISLQAESAPSLGLSFPLKGSTPGSDEHLDPNNAPITSVVDHSMMGLAHGIITMPTPVDYTIYKPCDHIVVAFTGERGDATPDSTNRCKHTGWTQASGACFGINGCYCGTGPTDLNYDNHPGFDFRASDGTQVYAAADGKVYYPKRVTGLQGSGQDWHVIGLIPDAAKDHVIYYLHLATAKPSPNNPPVPVTDPNPGSGCSGIVNLPLPDRPEGTQVKAGCLIALSGHKALGNPRNFPPHLHFEVQQVVDATVVQPGVRASKVECVDDTWVPTSSGKACLPVDPYGWTGAAGADPFELITGVKNKRLWSAPMATETCAEPGCRSQCQ